MKSSGACQKRINCVRISIANRISSGNQFGSTMMESRLQIAKRIPDAILQSSMNSASVGPVLSQSTAPSVGNELPGPHLDFLPFLFLKFKCAQA